MTVRQIGLQTDIHLLYKIMASVYQEIHALGITVPAQYRLRLQDGTTLLMVAVSDDLR